MLITAGPSASARLRSGSTSMPSAARPASASLAQPGRVLADAGGEDDRVGAAEHGEVGADVLAEPVAVDVVRRPRPLVAAVDGRARGRGSR